MKKLIILALLCVAIAFAAFPSFTYDFWLDMEACTADANLSTTELASSDNVSGGSWTKTDAGNSLTATTASEDAGHTWTTDTGAKGMAVALGGTTAYVEYTPAASHNSVSVGFWIKTGNYDSWNGGPTVVDLYDVANGESVRVQDSRNAGTNARNMCVLSATSPCFTVSDNTWYWFTFSYIRNSTSSYALYDSSGAQVGTTGTYTARDYAVTSVRIGNTNAHSKSGVSVYLDDIAIDWTDSTFPLIQSSASARRRVVLIQ